MTIKNSPHKLAVIGLGYVGLPLAVEFGKKREVIGFDINKKRIEELNNGLDETKEISKKELKQAKHLSFSCKEASILNSNFYIVTVPTPINSKKKPNLLPLFKATEIVAKNLRKNNIVVFESTVYPSVTEDECVPILEKYSNLKFNKEFFVGYSPERINPGDKKHTIKDIPKVVSGSNRKTAEKINKVYSEIITAGTYIAESIKVAEAAKVIENTQRDLNIALINELSIIFSKMNIDTESVINAAKTKWNFIPFWPGLVGGHCIGVDPYYLTYKSKKLGYNPEIILAGRKLNDSMKDHVSQNLIKGFSKKKIKIKNSKILVMGLTFKENCSDIRNSLILEVCNNLIFKGCEIYAIDPWVNDKSGLNNKKINLIKQPLPKKYDGVIIAVKHKQFINYKIKTIKSWCKSKHIIYDLKYLLKKEESDIRL